MPSFGGKLCFTAYNYTFAALWFRAIHPMTLKVCQLCAVDFTLKHFLTALIDGMQATGWRVTAVCSDGPFVADLRRAGYAIETLSIARSLVEVDPKTAINWVGQLPAGDARNQAIQNIASAVAQNSPQDAANYVATLPPGPAQTQAASAVISQWAESDPKAAAAWAGGFPQDVQKDAYQEIASGWAREDAEGAGEWLKSLPQGASRDAAVSAFASQTASDNPQMAMAWAQTVGDSAGRTDAMENVARGWLQTDPAAAKTWIKTSALPADAKASLLETPARQSIPLDGPPVNRGEVYPARLNHSTQPVLMPQ